VRRALEDEVGCTSPEVVAHLADCRSCAGHQRLVALLSGLDPGDAGDAEARQVLLDLPIAPWQLRRAATWAPLAAGGVLAVGGLVLLGGVPAGGELLGLPAGAYSFVASTALDLAAAARGSVDAVQAMLTAGGSVALLWLAGSALGGSLAVRALLRRPARGRA
jgi:hypothetical protein